MNAIWDLYAQLSPANRSGDCCPTLPRRESVRCVDFRYLTDALTPDAALELLERAAPGGWTHRPAPGGGTSRLHHQCRMAGGVSRRQDPPPLPRGRGGEGWTHLKVKVGRDRADDIRRLAIIREELGWDRHLMVDANQVWDVPQAIEWMRGLARFKPLWIEEPTSPDDVLGHAAIARAMEPLGIGVATGEHGMNRVLFKQLLQARAISYCQIDSCRVGGVNENLAILLLAAQFGVPAARGGTPVAWDCASSCSTWPWRTLWRSADPGTDGSASSWITSTSTLWIPAGFPADGTSRRPSPGTVRR